MTGPDAAITAAKPATAAYFAYAATDDGPFDHQRDAYEQGYEDGSATHSCMLCDDLAKARAEARAAERQRWEPIVYRLLNGETVDVAELLDGAS